MAVALVRAQGLVLPPPKLEMEMNHGPRGSAERERRRQELNSGNASL